MTLRIIAGYTTTGNDEPKAKQARKSTIAYCVLRLESMNDDRKSIKFLFNRRVFGLLNDFSSVLGQIVE